MLTDKFLHFGGHNFHKWGGEPIWVEPTLCWKAGGGQQLLFKRYDTFRVCSSQKYLPFSKFDKILNWAACSLNFWSDVFDIYPITFDTYWYANFLSYLFEFQKDWFKVYLTIHDNTNHNIIDFYDNCFNRNT